MSAARMFQLIGKVTITGIAVIATALAALMFAPGLLGLDRYVITGASMSGNFERGTLVLEQQVPVSELRVGDIITYLPPAESGLTELVTHRIISIEPNPQDAEQPVFRTQGDANAGADPWVFTLADSVQPRVVGWVPLVGWVFIGLAEPGIRMLVIGVPAAFIALLFLRDLVRTVGRPRSAAPTPAPAPTPARTPAGIEAARPPLVSV